MRCLEYSLPTSTYHVPRTTYRLLLTTYHLSLTAYYLLVLLTTCHLPLLLATYHYYLPPTTSTYRILLTAYYTSHQLLLYCLPRTTQAFMKLCRTALADVDDPLPFEIFVGQLYQAA